MTRLATALCLCAALAASPATRADEGSGVTVGLRAGFAMPLGSAGDREDLDRLTSGAVPLQLEVGYRFTPRWQAGAYASWGPTLVASDAKGALAAQGATGIGGHAVQRLGVQAIWTPLETPRFRQWLGVGLGYEWTRYAEATLHSSTGSGDAELGLRGLEATLQLGGDVRVTRRLSIGPFATASFGQYRSRVSDVDVRSGTMANAGSTTSSVKDRGVHEWLQLGVRTSWDF